MLHFHSFLPNKIYKDDTAKITTSELNGIIVVISCNKFIVAYAKQERKCPYKPNSRALLEEIIMFCTIYQRMKVGHMETLM